MEVIDTAKNGKEAVEKAASLRPDVITMDIEMPVMDGISAVREIMAKTPTPILMFSSLTHDGRITSYNVCYTKLLRSSNFFGKKSKAPASNASSVALAPSWVREENIRIGVV